MKLKRASDPMHEQNSIAAAQQTVAFGKERLECAETCLAVEDLATQASSQNGNWQRKLYTEEQHPVFVQSPSGLLQ